MTVYKRFSFLSVLPFILGVMVSESESRPSSAPDFLDLKFHWNDQEAIGARGIVYGMEYPNIEYSVGGEPPYKGTEVVQLSPFPFLFPKRMHAAAINADLDPQLSTEAGILKISISWNESPTALQEWLENGLYPSKRRTRTALELEERRGRWAEDLRGNRPSNLPIRIQRITRNFKDTGSEMDTAFLAKAVLSKSTSADFELALPAMASDEEWISLELPEFSISIERPKSKSLLFWLNREREEEDAGYGNKQSSPTPQKVEGSRKRPFWQFWKKGE